MTSQLKWSGAAYGPEATLGDFSQHDGVRFSVMFLATCYRRGQWRLLIEIASHDHAWGCFDEQDQPVRYYHSLVCLKAEAQAIADVLVNDHQCKDKKVKAT